MNPALMVAIAIFLPVSFISLLLGPFYIGLCGCLIFYYHSEEVMTYAIDPNYIIGLHEGLYEFTQEQETLDWMGFMLPVYGPVAFGALVSLICAYSFARYIRKIFVLT